MFQSYAHMILYGEEDVILGIVLSEQVNCSLRTLLCQVLHVDEARSVDGVESKCCSIEHVVFDLSEPLVSVHLSFGETHGLKT